MQRSLLLLLVAVPAVLFGLAAAMTWMHSHPNRWFFTLAATAFLLLTGYLANQWCGSPDRAPVVG